MPVPVPEKRTSGTGTGMGTGTGIFAVTSLDPFPFIQESEIMIGQRECMSDQFTTTQERKISPWAIHRRMYEWVLSFAHSKHAFTALFLLSVAESSFFPVAPDILQIAMTLEKNSYAWRYAFISTIGSVLGGLIGYGIGALVWSHVSQFFFHYIFTEQTFESVGNLYQSWDFIIVFVAAFTPIPYKVITIAAGVFGISLPMFLIASIIGRGGRFFLVAGLLRYFGPSIKQMMDKYFNFICILLALLLISGFIILKML